MSVVTRRQLLENIGVKDLVGLSNVQLKTLKDNYLIKNLQGLALVDKANVDSIIGTDKDTFFMRRQLTMVMDFIGKGGSLTGSTTIQTIMTWFGGGRNSLSLSAGKNKATAPIKLSPANFPTFSEERYWNRSTTKPRQRHRLGKQHSNFC
eukprot:12478410-Ditylum_brightwellii.AAC.1